MAKKRNLKTWLVMAVFLVGMAPAIAAGGTIYVDADASGGGNGQTWGTAYKYLQDALYKPPTGGDQIWVAQGTYKPDANTANPGGTGDRTATFQLIDGVAIKGGYAGYGQPDPNERDIQLYETILSGDLDGNDTPLDPCDPWDDPSRGDNSYHVVTGSGTDATAVLDGFTITGGNAPYAGGGMYNDMGSPTVTNCVFRANSAYYFGGGMDNWSSSPTVTNCIFSGNSGGGGGGGMCNSNSNPTLTNCAFSGNSAPGIFISEGGGGGMYNRESSPTLTNCIFSGNSAGRGGGGMSNYYDSNPTLTNCTFTGNSAMYGDGMENAHESSPILTNCVLWGNTPEQIAGSAVVTYSNVQGGWEGEGNIDEDPLFKDADGPDDIPGTEDDNLELAAGSPCIDAGDNGAVPADTVDLDEDGNTSERTPLDLGGSARFTDDPLTDDTGVPATGYPEIVEMGAYERYEFCGDAGHPFPVGDVNRDCKVNFLDIAIIAAHWLEDAGPE